MRSLSFDKIHKWIKNKISSVSNLCLDSTCPEIMFSFLFQIYSRPKPIIITYALHVSFQFISYANDSMEIASSNEQKSVTRCIPHIIATQRTISRRDSKIISEKSIRQRLASPQPCSLQNVDIFYGTPKICHFLVELNIWEPRY